LAVLTVEVGVIELVETGICEATESDDSKLIVRAYTVLWMHLGRSSMP